MATPGRRPTPTAKKKLMGNPGRRPLNAKEPKPRSAMPQPPRHLGKDALNEWKRVVRELYLMGVLTRIDRGVLAAYCESYGDWCVARRKIAHMATIDTVTDGLLAKTSNGTAIQNPLLGIANRARRDMVRYAAELGMTPSARSRVDADPPPPAEDPASKYFIN